MTETAATRVIGATRLLEALEQLGVELVFGLPGVHNLPIWKALSESDVRLIGVRPEQTAVYAADGYARATG
ncbi:MAG: acetolactate synthase large subunit, partial [Solirubrobacterales bacterium]|nr:acetolactate synthase large subunit [Solirubrobacterales bacterium]